MKHHPDFPFDRWLRPVRRRVAVGVRAGCGVGRVVLVVVLAGCGARREVASASPVLPVAPAAYEEGVASWYGPGLHGRRTASGEVFDQNALTAAHPRLPFGTRVRVVHVGSGRQVEVRINDRGPFTGNRVIDLSRAAAESLGMVREGTARVRLYLLRAGGAAGARIDGALPAAVSHEFVEAVLRPIRRGLAR